MRPSHGVADYMQRHGYRIIPVNPHEESVLGEKCYASLDAVPEPFDVVVIFRRSEFVPEVVEAAIRKGAKVVWMQEGVVPRAGRRARPRRRPQGRHGPMHSEGTRQALCGRKDLGGSITRKAHGQNCTDRGSRPASLFHKGSFVRKEKRPTEAERLQKG